MYNEEGLAHIYCQEMKKMTEGLAGQYDFEIILVNDGSQDDTYSIMLEEQALNPKEITTTSYAKFWIGRCGKGGNTTGKGGCGRRYGC